MIIGAPIIVGTMSSGSSDGWTRPSAWPDYDQIDISNEECIFFTYGHAATTDMDFIAVEAMCSGGYTVERGYLVNGTWTVDTTNAVSSGARFFEALPTNRDFVCYKLYPTTSGNHITSIKMQGPTTYNGYTSGISSNVCYAQPCLERYGNLPYVTSISTWSCRYLQAETELSISGITNMNSLFKDCSSLQSLDVSGWDTSSVTSMNNTFSGCYSLRSLDVSGWDTSSVRDMSGLFIGCNSLQSLDVSGWDTSNVTSMVQVFSGCSNLYGLDISGWNTSSVTSMESMFNGCYSLQSLDVSDWDTSGVKNMSYIFCNCSTLQNLDVSEWDVSSITNMSNMFQNCYSLQSLDVSGWDTSGVKNMNYMFYNCNNLQSLDVSSWDFSGVTSMGSVFQNCYFLQNISFTNITTVGSSMFAYCPMATAFVFNVSAVPTLSNTDAFTGNNFANGQKILFPSALVDTAKAATNWSTYASYIDAIS